MPPTKQTNTVQFRQWNCTVQYETYRQGGRIAICLLDDQDSTPVATATRNVPEYPLPEGHVLIKDNDENEGMVQALAQAGIISEPLNWVPCGFYRLAECKLLANPE